VLSPALLLFFSRQLLPDENLNIQYQTIVVTLVGTQLAPLTIGLVIRQLATVRAQRVARIVGPIGNALLLVAIVLVLVNEFETLKVIRLSTWMGMLTLLAASLAIGWFCGGPDRATRKALAVTTTARNAAVALVIVSASFAGTSAVCAVVAFGLVSIVGTLIGAWLLRCVGPALPLGRQPSAAEADVLSD
jgi:BASS family bile acid:Na+ symporter